MTGGGTGGSAVPGTRSASRLSRRDVVSTGIFVVLAFGLSWVIALPLWLGDGLASPAFSLVALAMMATPALAALAIVFLVERPRGKARRLLGRMAEARVRVGMARHTGPGRAPRHGAVSAPKTRSRGTGDHRVSLS